MKKTIFLLLATLSWPTLAERWFDVEVIVFKHNISPSKTGESFPNNAEKVNMSNVIHYSDSAGLAKYQIEPLNKSQFELIDQYQQLVESNKYKEILHVGWRQNDAGRSKMPKIRLNGGSKLGSVSELDGYIRLYVDHYLFLETDLVLSQSASRPVETKFDPRTNEPASSSFESYLKRFNFKQKRRMRSSEIHYIDHPLMGLIIQVRRLDQDN